MYLLMSVSLAVDFELYHLPCNLVTSLEFLQNQGIICISQVGFEITRVPPLQEIETFKLLGNRGPS